MVLALQLLVSCGSSGAPDQFRKRDPLKSCGSIGRHRYDEPMSSTDRSAIDCLRQARSTSEPAELDYILLTAAVLVERGSNSDLTLGERCDLPEPDYFTRQTLAKLLATFPLLNFGNVQADAVYLMPGSEDDGFSQEDLLGGGYKYLKPLT